MKSALEAGVRWTLNAVAIIEAVASREPWELRGLPGQPAREVCCYCGAPRSGEHLVNDPQVIRCVYTLALAMRLPHA